MSPRVRVFVGSSLDGFIAGPDDDLSFLDPPEGAQLEDDHGFGQLLEETGALLMGRRTYDVVTSFDVPWPYGERPVLVATRRPLEPVQPTVRAISGSITELIQQAKAAAAGKDVYLDGGDLIRQALTAGLVEELTITVVPIAIGRGVPLLAGLEQAQRLERVAVNALSHGMVQLVYRPLRS